MPLNIPVSELQQAAKKQVYDARKHNRLSSLTPRIIRQVLERKFNLEEGTLDEDEFKALRAQLKSAITEATEEDIPADDEVSTPKTTIPKTKKRKSEEILEPKQNKKPNTKPQKKNSKQFKSLETIPTSDIEDPEDNDNMDTSAELDTQSAGPSEKAPKFTSPKRLPKPIPSKTSGSVAKPSARPSTTSTPEPHANSDSELSVLEDEPPKKKKAKATKPKDTEGDKPKSSKGKKASVSSSKDEDTIKRLKSFILACGIRKKWATVFKDVESPSEQIRMLKAILSDLGMSGRMSLEQAKAIKEKRELAQELEDVQTFAAAATRSKARKPSEEEDEEESEAEELPAKRKTNARKSIMAFLGDQSDED